MSEKNPFENTLIILHAGNKEYFQKLFSAAIKLGAQHIRILTFGEKFSLAVPVYGKTISVVTIDPGKKRGRVIVNREEEHYLSNYEVSPTREFLEFMVGIVYDYCGGESVERILVPESEKELGQLIALKIKGAFFITREIESVPV